MVSKSGLIICDYVVASIEILFLILNHGVDFMMSKGKFGMFTDILC